MRYAVVPARRGLPRHSHVHFLSLALEIKQPQSLRNQDKGRGHGMGILAGPKLFDALKYIAIYTDAIGCSTL